MRIIAGKYKNKKIITETRYIKLERNRIRPTTEKLRAAVFNILPNFFNQSHNDVLSGKKVLDLFCGVGSFGIEALSRGAELVAFVDNHKAHLDIVRLNLERINCLEKTSIILKQAQTLGCSTEIYDAVYIDPPYNLKVIDQVINNLIANKWVDNNTLIIIELSKDNPHHNISSKIKIVDERRYNDSSVLFCFAHLN